MARITRDGLTTVSSSVSMRNLQDVLERRSLTMANLPKPTSGGDTKPSPEPPQTGNNQQNEAGPKDK